MAITKIHPIKSTLHLAIAYIVNGDKTDEQLLVSTHKCHESTAHTQFLRTRNDAGTKGTVLARHLIQSFLPGETSPELAHQIGMELCKKILKDEYEFVLSTHVDKGHIHNHIIFNNVNMVTGRCYQSNKKSYHQIRYQSDKLCKENSLSVIDEFYESYKKKYKINGKSWYENEQAKHGTSWKSRLQFDIDRMIKQSKDWDEFLKKMADLGYEIKYVKHIAFNSLVSTFQAKYDEYKETRQQEIENKAELFNLYEYISIYNEIQGEKTKNLSYYGQIKKGNADLKRFVKAIYYLKDNHLQTIADLQGKVFELAKQSKKISGDIQEKTQRIKDLNQCVSCIDSIKENKEVYQEYKSKTIFKDSFYNSHKKEIDRYLRARKTIEKFTGTSAIKLSDWQKEISSLENQIQELTKDKVKVQDEFKQIDHIKYAVKIVNDEYGIDLSIEIDKAIKRGDKPSVIAQLKKFQEQEERKGQYKQKAKEKYSRQER